jgi:four helix bundle protein
MAGIKRPEDFDVWKLGWELKRRVFAFTAASPATSDRRFCDDIRRAARSGPDLVAEGYYRFNPREFHRFLNDAKASLGEVRNQLMHAKDERFVDDEEFRDMSSLANCAIGAANALQKYLRRCPTKFTQRPNARAHAVKQPDAAAEPETKNRNPEPQNPEPRTARSTYHRFSS